MGRAKRARREQLDRPVADARDGSSSFTARRWLPALLLAWVALLYAPSLWNGFTYDDPSIVSDASELLSNPQLMGRLFTLDYFRLSGESTFRPVVTVSYVLDWQVGAGRPWAFHLQSLIWHIVTVGCLIVFLPRLGASRLVTYAIAAFYGVHPALTEAVDAIAFREDVLVAALGILGLLMFTGTRPRSRALRLSVGTLCFAGALFSKESGLVFLVLLPLTHWVIAKQAIPPEPWRPSRYAVEYLSLFICVFLYLVVRFWLLPASASYGMRVSDSLIHAVATGVVAIAYYLRLLVYPHPLCADYRGVVTYVTSLSDWRFWISLGLIALLTAVAWRQRKSNPLAAWGWAWFFAAILPVANLVPIPAFMAERFLYLPYIGLLTFVVALVAPRVAVGSRAVVAISIVLLLVLSGVTWVRQRAWSSNDVLWRTTLDDFPSAHGALHGYGSALIESGQFMEAITYLRRVLDDPSIGRDRRAVVARELGFAHISLGQVSEAITRFEESLAATPTSMAHQNLAVVLLRLDRLSEAEAHMREAIRLEPDGAEGYSGLGAALARQGRVADAIEAYREAVRLEPSLASAHANLGVALATAGRPNEAVDSLLQAIALEPDQSRWRTRVATLLHEQGRTAEGIQQLEAALRVDPDDAEASDELRRLMGR